MVGEALTAEIDLHAFVEVFLLVAGFGGGGHSDVTAPGLEMIVL